MTKAHRGKTYGFLFLVDVTFVEDRRSVLILIDQDFLETLKLDK